MLFYCTTCRESQSALGDLLSAFAPAAAEKHDGPKKHQLMVAVREFFESGREWRRKEREARQTKALKESREELFALIDSWAVARPIESFFEDAERRAQGLTPEERVGLLDRLNRARQLLGGTDALKRFGSWRSPEEREPSLRGDGEPDDPEE